MKNKFIAYARPAMNYVFYVSLETNNTIIDYQASFKTCKSLTLIQQITRISVTLGDQWDSTWIPHHFHLLSTQNHY